MLIEHYFFSTRPASLFENQWPNHFGSVLHLMLNTTNLEKKQNYFVNKQTISLQEKNWKKDCKIGLK